MPVKKAAFKALRQDKKRALHNKKVKDNIAYLLKKAGKFIEAKDKNKAKELIDKAVKALDKAAKRNIMKKNTCNRVKSRLIKRFNTME